MVGFARTAQQKPNPGKVTRWQAIGGIGSAGVQRISVQQDPDEIKLSEITFTDKDLRALSSFAEALAKGPFCLVIQDHDGHGNDFTAPHCTPKDSTAFTTVPISDTGLYSVFFFCV